MAVRIINADVLDGLGQLADESIDCVVTSPPYWGLRDYGVVGQIGLEPTLEEFLERMTGVFREVRRVLKASGTCFVNMGDAYATGGGSGLQGRTGQRSGRRHTQERILRTRPHEIGLKAKDLMMQPARLALALQADGWWLRSEIVWNKSNPMPDSARDRPGSSHEMIYLLTKSARYFWDLQASRESDAAKPAQKQSGRFIKGDAARDPATRTDGWSPGRFKVPGAWATGEGAHGTIHKEGRTSALYVEDRGDMLHGHNMRDVWTFATYPCAEAHFATFPPELPRRCITAGCPEQCCANCGAPWARKTDVFYENPGNRSTNGPRSKERKNIEHGTAGYNQRLEKRVVDQGIAASCKCETDAVPGVVLDIFGGSGTTGFVAEGLGRDAILIELNPDTVKIAKRRIAAERLKRKRATMADVVDAGITPTPLEAWLQNAETRVGQ